MPLLTTKKKPAAPVINAGGSQTAREGHRIVSIELPVMKKLTDAQIEEHAAAEGKDVIAICDFTGEPICQNKNLNVINNPERPDLHGKVMSTKFLNKILEAAGIPVAKSMKKPKSARA